MYSQHSLTNGIYHPHHGSEQSPPQPHRYHHSSSRSPSSPSSTDLQQSTNNRDIHHHQPHGTDLIGRAVHFSTGQFAGQTIRMELKEIQKADLGRKSVWTPLLGFVLPIRVRPLMVPIRYARVDRRPLDPPPVVLLRIFQVHNLGSNRETEKELNYESVIDRVSCFIC